MREVESDWWFLDLPECWLSEQDEESILIYDEDELGCISLSALVPDNGAVDEAALRSLIEEYGKDVFVMMLYGNFVLQCCSLFAFGWLGAAFG